MYHIRKRRVQDNFVVESPVTNQIISQPNTTQFGVEATNGTTSASISVNATGTGGGYSGSPIVGFNGYMDIAAITSKITSSSYTIGIDDVSGSITGVSYVADATSNDVTINLPVIATVGNGYIPIFIISRNDSTPGGNTVTVAAADGNTIAGSSSVTLDNWGSVTLIQTSNDSGNSAVDWIITAQV